MEGDGALLLGSHHLGLLFQSADDAVHSSQEVILVHSLLSVTRSNESRLVADICDICTTEARRLTSQEVDIERTVGLDGFQVNLEDFLALVHVGKLNMYLTIEASGTKQGFVQDVGTVCCSHDDDAAVGSEAVHLGEELVECAFTFVVGSHLDATAAGTAHGINLVDEDDAGSFLLSLTEEVAYSACTDAHEHLHEVAARHAEERHVGFARHGFRQQRLTRSGRANKQSTFGNLAAQFCIALRVLEELHNLLHLKLSASLSCYISKGDLVLVVLLEEFGTALAHVEDAHRSASFASSAHSSHEEYPEEDDEDEWTEAPEEVHEVVFSLTILYFAFEVFESLLFAYEVFEFVGRRNLHNDIRPCALLYLLFLEDVAYVFGLDIHLQSPFLLVDDDARGIALLHITLELAVRCVSR